MLGSGRTRLRSSVFLLGMEIAPVLVALDSAVAADHAVTSILPWACGGVVGTVAGLFEMLRAAVAANKSMVSISSTVGLVVGVATGDVRVKVAIGSVIAVGMVVSVGAVGSIDAGTIAVIRCAVVDVRGALVDVGGVIVDDGSAAAPVHVPCVPSKASAPSADDRGAHGDSASEVEADCGNGHGWGNIEAQAARRRRRD